MIAYFWFPQTPKLSYIHTYTQIHNYFLKSLKTKRVLKAGMVEHSFNPGIWEAESASEVKTSLAYIEIQDGQGCTEISLIIKEF